MAIWKGYFAFPDLLVGNVKLPLDRSCKEEQGDGKARKVVALCSFIHGEGTKLMLTRPISPPDEKKKYLPRAGLASG